MIKNKSTLKLLMIKHHVILMILIIINLAINVRQVLSVTEAFCNHNIFQSNECGKYCPGDKSYWCDTSENPDAKIGDPPTKCENDKNKCQAEWKCVSSCKANMDEFNPFKIWGIVHTG